MENYINFSPGIADYFSQLQAVLASVDKRQIEEAMNALLKAYHRTATIYCCGNGGSASTASHLLNDFNKGISFDLPKKFNVCCLNDNMAFLTAIANDIDYAAVFSAQLEGKLKNGDVLIAISGSGNSRNVLNAAEYAHSCGCEVIGITGYDGGELKKISDYHMHVPSFSMQIVEDIHLIFNHMMMKILHDYLKQEDNKESWREKI